MGLDTCNFSAQFFPSFFLKIFSDLSAKNPLKNPWELRDNAFEGYVFNPICYGLGYWTVSHSKSKANALELLRKNKEYFSSLSAQFVYFNLLEIKTCIYMSFLRFPTLFFSFLRAWFFQTKLHFLCW